MDLNLSNRARKKLEHLAPSEWKALEELVNRLYQQYGGDLLRVVLFGSKAYIRIGLEKAHEDLQSLFPDQRRTP